MLPISSLNTGSLKQTLCNKGNTAWLARWPNPVRIFL